MHIPILIRKHWISSKLEISLHVPSPGTRGKLWLRETTARQTVSAWHLYCAEPLWRKCLQNTRYSFRPPHWNTSTSITRYDIAYLFDWNIDLSIFPRSIHPSTTCRWRQVNKIWHTAQSFNKTPLTYIKTFMTETIFIPCLTISLPALEVRGRMPKVMSEVKCVVAWFSPASNDYEWRSFNESNCALQFECDVVITW